MALNVLASCLDSFSDDVEFQHAGTGHDCSRAAIHPGLPLSLAE